MKIKSIKSDIDVLSELPVLVDTLILQDRFSRYKSPKKKVSDLKKKGYLQSIQKGQHFNLKSKNLESTPFEVLANSLFSPSYVSIEWALQYYGLIADRVEQVTSVTIRSSKEFKTATAIFSYEHIHRKRYPVGYVSISPDSDISFFIARPEKALIDYVSLRAKNLKIKSEKDIQKFLDEDIRLNLKSFLEQTKPGDVRELLPFYHRNSKEHRILVWLLVQKEKVTKKGRS